MLDILVAELTSHPEMSTLNSDASKNMPCMVVTELTSQLERSALNADADSNMYLMSVTELVSHPEMSALNDVASSNIFHIVVTELTSQTPISSQPAAPHRAVAGSPQFASWLTPQQALPVALCVKQLSTATLSAALSAKGDASEPSISMCAAKRIAQHSVKAPLSLIRVMRRAKACGGGRGDVLGKGVWRLGSGRILILRIAILAKNMENMVMIFDLSC